MLKNRRLIIFFVPPEKLVNGGIMSIFSLCNVSRAYKNIHGAEVTLATYPGAKSYRKNDLFENDETVYSFDELVARGVPQTLQLHIPEYASGHIFSGLKKYSEYLRTIPDLSVNIMNQNILYMPKPFEAAHWFSLTSHVTQTTAHSKYSTQVTANLYNMPTRHFSTFLASNQYKWTPYEKKENLIVLSPDAAEKKELIVKKLAEAFPSYKIVTIQDMSYEEYKHIISKARFTVTFGEGFDGYYLETFFSGGITYAVYNDSFFPDRDFSGFVNTYQNYDDMLSHIVTDMKTHDRKATYERIVRKNFEKLNKLYSFAQYTENIKKFYQKKFTYLPEPGSAERLIGSIIAEQERLLAIKLAELVERDKAIHGQSKMIAQRDEIIAAKDRELAKLFNSHSWKLTKPLRAAARLTKKKS